MRALNRSQLARSVSDRCGCADADAAVAVTAVLDALAQTVPEHARAHFGALLPPRSRLTIVTLPQLIADVASAADQSPAAAFERIEVVCAAIADAWSDADGRVVGGALPLDVAALFTPPELATPSRPLTSAPRHTLSSGRASAAHPISTSPLTDGAHSLAAGHAQAERPLVDTPPLARRTT